MKNNKKMPYVKLYDTSTKSYFYCPYVEAQEFTIYEIYKSSIIWLTDEELKEIENRKD